MNIQKQVYQEIKNHIFRKIICCDCLEHMITLDADDIGTIVYLNWWAKPNNTSFFKRIHQAFDILRGKDVEYRDFILNPDTLNELIEGCIEAQNYIAQPYNEEEEKEIYKAIQKIRRKYAHTND